MSRLNRESPQELPCVWVHAGVLSYRPCHRNFECESCELFHALSGPHQDRKEAGVARQDTQVPGRLQEAGEGRIDPEIEEAVTAYLTQLTEGCDLHLDLPYSPGHFWLKEAEEGEVLIGLDCQTLRILFPVEDFTLPKPGVWLKRGEAMGWVQRGHRVIPLLSPISGEVREVNHELVREILERGFPWSQARWLIRVTPHEPLADIPDLLRGQTMLGWYQRKLNLVREYLLDAMDPGTPMGQTLNDGGALNRNLEEVLGSYPFQELLDRMFLTL